ncbi:MAG: chromosome segregation protein SMC [Hyphomicrobiaceae bacterium]|nr:chromosome segregation protein SMC [Hyphomicrobiaceae bacterium]
MKISRLRLLGFKSFVEPTELVIEPGLTGVVGPNGCGKSNLLEALRWVMGETSHKSMRAAAMDDVIFSGTTARPPRVAAEVTMFLDNTERLAPAEYNDRDAIEITRRIEREAGSAYRINGKEARARDIKILFEDAATGARSPALVRQGQIGEIVNAKPEQRRRILEDAAGIAGLHSRRHEAELRLKAAETNLARITDVLGQVSSQIDSLKRQARQARRYKEISEEIRKKEALQAHLTWTEAQANVDKGEANLRDALEVLTKALADEAHALKDEVARAEVLPSLREAEAARAAALHRVKVEVETFEREARQAAERQQELQARVEQLTADLIREETLIGEARDLIARLDAEIATLASADDAAADAEDAADAAHASAAQILLGAEGELADVTQRAAESRAQRRALEAAAAERGTVREKLERQLAALLTQERETSGKSPDAAKLAEIEALCGELGDTLEDIEARNAEADSRVAAATEDLKVKRAAAEKSRLAINAITTERETLARLLVVAHGEDVPAIIDQLRVSPGYETALGAALGDDLDAPIDDTSAVRWRLVAVAGTDPKLPGGAVALSKHVKGPPELARRLAQVGVVPRADGLALQTQLLPGQRLVSREGDLWRWDGFTAAAEGATAAAQRLAQRNRLSALEFEEAEARESGELLAEAETAAVDELAEAEAERRLASDTWRATQTRLTQNREALAGLERARQDSETRLAAIIEQRQRVEDDLTEAHGRAEEDALALESLAPADDLEETLATARRAADTARTTAAEALANVAELRRQRQSRAERRAAALGDLERWQSRSANAEQQIKRLNERIAATRAELDGLADLPAKLQERRRALLDAVGAAEAERQAAADQLAAAEMHLHEARTTLRAAQGNVSTAREGRARIEAHLESARQRRLDEARRIRESLGVIPEGCLPLAGFEPGDALPPLDEVERQLAKLKGDRERLGGVNLAADDELTTMAEQFETLDAERSDVEEAIGKLRGAIQQINREAKKRLDEAFHTVNGHFARLFSTLFGGGEARLEMVEGDDPLEGGLEIIAKPPGKKPATLSLLSGGEQTLTALSLIFAVFLTNPSPICVLDEVDAPLDDANVDRFCTLMEKMAADTATRFLVITHHPMTMARMNRLFGVTMAEKGVSQLVSVNLETAHGFLEAS